MGAWNPAIGGNRMTDAQFLFSALVAFVIIIFGLHRIVRAVHDFDEDAEQQWKDIEWWW